MPGTEGASVHAEGWVGEQPDVDEPADDDEDDCED